MGIREYGFFPSEVPGWEILRLGGASRKAIEEAHLALTHRLESAGDGGRVREDVLDLVAERAEANDPQRELPGGVLEDHASVDRHESVERRLSEGQQFAVSDPEPTGGSGRLRDMGRKRGGERLGNALIENDPQAARRTASTAKSADAWTNA